MLSNLESEVSDRITEFFSKNTSMIYFSLVQALVGCPISFAEDVLAMASIGGCCHAKSYRNFKAEFDRLNAERVAAFREFRADIRSGAYPGPEHSVAIAETEFEAFLQQVGAR